MVDWEVVGTKLGDLNQKAVTKRWSRLNIKMRGDGEDGEDGEDGDMVEIGTDATQEILSGSESGNDDQKVDTEETSGGKSVAKKRTRKASVRPTTGTKITGVTSDDAASTDGQMVTIRETTGEKATAKKRSCKNPVKNKAIIGRSKVVKIKATWESVKAEVAAEAKAKE